jgi:hypothetical protein
MTYEYQLELYSLGELTPAEISALFAAAAKDPALHARIAEIDRTNEILDMASVIDSAEGEKFRNTVREEILLNSSRQGLATASARKAGILPRIAGVAALCAAAGGFFTWQQSSPIATIPPESTPYSNPAVHSQQIVSPSASAPTVLTSQSGSSGTSENKSELLPQTITRHSIRGKAKPAASLYAEAENTSTSVNQVMETMEAEYRGAAMESETRLMGLERKLGILQREEGNYTGSEIYLLRGIERARKLHFPEAECEFMAELALTKHKVGKSFQAQQLMNAAVQRMQQMHSSELPRWKAELQNILKNSDDKP